MDCELTATRPVTILAMRKLLSALAVLLLPLVVHADPLVHTFSIVARDPATGEMGVAAQSFVDPGYGVRGLELMRRGVAAPDALDQLVKADAQRDGRQVAMIDAAGRVSAYTGKSAIAAAGHVVGQNFSAQANLMANDRVWPAMAKAFETTKGDLAEIPIPTRTGRVELPAELQDPEKAVEFLKENKERAKPVKA